MIFEQASRIFSPGNYVRYYNSVTRVAELRSTEVVIFFDDGTLLPVDYGSLEGITLEPNVLLKIGCTRVSKYQYDLHMKEIYKLDVLGKVYYIHIIQFDDQLLLRLENFISLRFLHELQNILTVINPEFVVSLV